MELESCIVTQSQENRSFPVLMEEKSPLWNKNVEVRCLKWAHAFCFQDNGKGMEVLIPARGQLVD